MDFEPITHYGLGLILEVTQTGTIYDHSGGALAYTSFMIYDPERDITMSLAMNTRTNSIAMVQNMFYALGSGFPQVPDDIAAAEIVSPYARGCMNNISPEIVLLNNGNNPVATATIHYTVDNGPVTSFAWGGNLAPGATVQVTLPSFTAFAGNHTLKCFTGQPNGNQDGFARNDTVETAFIIDSLTVSGYLLEDFEGPVFPAPGTIVAPQKPFTWDRTTLVSANGDACLVKNLYFDWQVGNIYDFDLPYYDVTGMNNPVMEFKLAYALFPNIFDDTLQVLVSDDCGLTWQVLHSEGGTSMNTGGVTQAMYFPLPSDWETRQVSLSGYTGSLHFRFRAISGFGNNLFIDDIVISDATAIAENGNNNGSRVSMYPNPVTESATVVTGSNLQNGEMRIYDQTGRLAAISEQLRGKKHTFEKGNLKSGMYFFTVTENGTVIGSGKFIVN
jgi:hypothetical protein